MALLNAEFTMDYLLALASTCTGLCKKNEPSNKCKDGGKMPLLQSFSKFRSR